MKLRMIISETSNRPISDGANSLADLIIYLKDNQAKFPKESRIFNVFLKTPTIKTWKKTKFIINNLINNAQNDTKGDVESRKVKWALLLNMPDAIASSCAYAVDPKAAANTPLAPLTQSKSKINDLMRLLGPGGWVTDLSGRDNVNINQIRADFKNTARSYNLIKNSLTYMKAADYKPAKPF